MLPGRTGQTHTHSLTYMIGELKILNFCDGAFNEISFVPVTSTQWFCG